MAFETGNPSFRVFHCGEEIGEGIIEGMRERLVPPVEAISASPVEAWAGWRHLLDRDLSEESCLFVPWLYVDRMKAERKIPKALLRAYCRMAEVEEMKKSGLQKLPSSIRTEIRERITAELTPDMPPTLSGYGVVTDFSTGLIYAEATSQKAAENFAGAFRETTGHNIAVMSPETVAVLRRNINQNDIAPACFTDDTTVEAPQECNLGLEFLTWMWYRWEEESDSFETSRGENMSYMLEGPVAFYNDGKGAHNVVIRNGLPLQSREAGASMLCGKKVRKIRLALADGERAWTATIDSDFAFTGVKLPKDRQGAQQSFQERMLLLDTFVEAVFSLYGTFLDCRADAELWRKTEGKMKKWTRRRAEMADGDITQH